MKYRDHRGGLAESMETVQEFDTRTELLAYLHKEMGTWGFKFDDSTVRIEPYGDGKDDRIGWNNLHIVIIEGFGPVGFADLPTASDASGSPKP